MKTHKYLLFPIILLLLTSCYIYKPYTPKDPEKISNNSDRSVRGMDLQSSKSINPAMSVRKEKEMQQNSAELEVTNEKELQKLEEKNKNTHRVTQNDTIPPIVSSDKNPIDPKDIPIKEKLEPNKYYKISALDNLYKIQVDKWEGDTLVAHKIRKPEKIYKLHMNDINNETVLERVFSKPFSDLLTVGAYATGAAIVLLLVL